MTRYKMTVDGYGILDLENGSFIPEDNQNKDWVEYQDWLSQGNGPLEPDTTIEDTSETKKANKNG